MDIYFEDNYGKLYETIEGGKSIVLNYTSEDGEVKHQFIQRKIPTDDGNNYYDLITPYGYGGPIIKKLLGEKNDLITHFNDFMQRYCEENNIISEFVRFHPLYNNALDFEAIYHPIFDRHTLGTNIAAYDNPIVSEFSKSCRKSIRQALNKGVTYRVTESPDNIGSFKEIYYSTMERDNASEFYYFKGEYFEDILATFSHQVLYVEAIYEEKTIAAGVYFISDGNIHTHLSGTISEFLYLSPAYILRYAATLWGKENGYKMIYHGGGTSSLEENSLYRFKKQFAKNTKFDFYVGKKIWNEGVYDRLCEEFGVDRGREFFPAYR